MKTVKKISKEYHKMFHKISEELTPHSCLTNFVYKQIKKGNNHPYYRTVAAKLDGYTFKDENIDNT